MYNKNLKTILFASLIVAMILPFSGMMMAEAAPNENANYKEKGELYIKDKNDAKGKYHGEMNKLNKVVKDENSSKDDKDKASKRVNEIKQLTKSTPTMSDEKQNKIREQIDIIGEVMSELSNVDKIPIVSVGTDYENESVNVAIDREGLTDQKIKIIEKKLRKLVGDDVDITISLCRSDLFT